MHIAYLGCLAFMFEMQSFFKTYLSHIEFES